MVTHTGVMTLKAIVNDGAANMYRFLITVYVMHHNKFTCNYTTLKGRKIYFW